jgi:Got1/Sft2-like family
MDLGSVSVRSADERNRLYNQFLLNVPALVATVHCICHSVHDWKHHFCPGDRLPYRLLCSVQNLNSRFKKMFDPSRLVASCVFIGSMILTLVAALAIKSGTPPLTQES